MNIYRLGLVIRVDVLISHEYDFCVYIFGHKVAGGCISYLYQHDYLLQTLGSSLLYMGIGQLNLLVQTKSILLLFI